MKLTQSQKYTILRMNSGTMYNLRADGKKGIEISRYNNEINDINAPSIPVLYKLGIITFIHKPTDNRYYRVELTEFGKSIIPELKGT